MAFEIKSCPSLATQAIIEAGIDQRLKILKIHVGVQMLTWNDTGSSKRSCLSYIPVSTLTHRSTDSTFIISLETSNEHIRLPGQAQV